MNERQPGPIAQGLAAGYAAAASGANPKEIAAALAAPSLAKLAQLSWDEIRQTRESTAEGFLVSTAAYMNTTPAHVVASDKSDEGKQLFMDGFMASLETLNQAKVRGFARAVAAGLLDDEARVDEELLIVSAIRDMDTPHIRALGRMAQERYGEDGRFNIRQIADFAGVAVLSAPPIVATLERHGILVLSQREAYDAIAQQVQNAFNDRATQDMRRRQQVGLGGFGGGPPALRVDPVNPTKKWLLSDFGCECWDYLATLDDEESTGVSSHGDTSA